MRPSWYEYFCTLARAAATRSTCDQNRGGAVIVRSNLILSTGYAGSPRNMPHCTHVGFRGHGRCPYAVHAEANAIALAARNGIALEGSTLYSTGKPCRACLRLMLQAGIVSFTYVGDTQSEQAGLFDTARVLAQPIPIFERGDTGDEREG